MNLTLDLKTEAAEWVWFSRSNSKHKFIGHLLFFTFLKIQNKSHLRIIHTQEHMHMRTDKRKAQKAIPAQRYTMRS